MTFTVNIEDNIDVLKVMAYQNKQTTEKLIEYLINNYIEEIINTKWAAFSGGKRVVLGNTLEEVAKLRNLR